MQVTQLNSNITHAVLGGEESITMQMTDDPAFLASFYQNLYSDIRLGVVREVLCNAWDAHIEAGKSDVPVEVTFNDGKMVIEDFGLGIPKEDIGPIYGVIGGSTKKLDKRTTGGFGYGSKAPFAYVDNFEVVSSNQGTKTVYRISKSSAQANGKPSITPIVSVPTEESGLRVTVSIRPDDVNIFKDLVRQVAFNGDILVNLDGSDVQDTIGLKEDGDGFCILNKAVLTEHVGICVRYGNVIYPVPSEHEELKGWVYKCLSLMREYLGSTHWNERRTLILLAPPSSLSLVPSRENLLMSDDTLETLIGLMKNFLHQANEAFTKVKNKAIPEAIDKQVELGCLHNLLSTSSRPAFKFSHKDPKDYWYSFADMKNKPIQSFDYLARKALVFNYPVHSFKDWSYRLDKLKAHSEWDFNMVENFQKALRGCTDSSGEVLRYITVPIQNWARKYIIKPMLKVGNTEGLSFDRILVNHEMWDKPYPVSKLLSSTDWTDLVGLLAKQVVITHSALKVRDLIRRNKKIGKNPVSSSYLIYRVQRNSKRIAAAVKAFEAVGYSVLNLCPQEEVVQKVPRIKKEKKKEGYPTLTSARQNRQFCQTAAAESEERITKPLAFTTLYAKSNRYADRACLPEISIGALCKLALDKWGDQIAVISSVVQANKLEEAGVPKLSKFITDYITEALANDAEIRRYLSNSPKSAAEGTWMRGAGIEIFWTVPELSKAAGLNFDLTPDQRFVIDMINTMSVDGYSRYSYLPGLREAVSRRDKKPTDPAVIKLIQKLSSSTTAKLIDFSVAAEILRGKAEEEKKTVIKVITSLFEE